MTSCHQAEPFVSPNNSVGALSSSERAIAATCPSRVKGGTLCALQPARGMVGPDGTLWLFCPREDHCLWYRMSTEDQADAIAALLAANGRVA